MSRCLLLSLACAPLLSSCGQSMLSPSWLIDRTRILGARAIPAEPAPGELVEFESLVVHPERSIESVIWTGCLSTEASEFGCELDESALAELEAGGEDLSPQELMDLLEAAGVLGIEPYLPPSMEIDPALLDELTEEQKAEGLNIILTLSAVPESEGEELDPDMDVEIAYKRIPISTGSTPNNNPEILALEVDGNRIEPGQVVYVSAGQSYDLDVVLSDESVEDYTYINSEGSSEERTEEPYFTWYFTDGQPSLPFSLHPYGISWTATPWSAEALEGSVTAYVVARDRRGGMAWLTQEFYVE